jgi:hypothetical protein
MPPTARGAGGAGKAIIPWFDGALLDSLVDYLNYVIA